MRIQLVPRIECLRPVAVVGVGEVARTLGARLLEARHEHLRALRALVGDDLLIVLGDVDHLPWVDGVEYLGRDPAAPRLLVPTALTPSLAMDAFERAILAHAKDLPTPIAVIAAPRRIFSVGDAATIGREALGAWLEQRTRPRGERAG